MNTVNFLLNKADEKYEISVSYENLFAIGYAGRNMEKTMEHIRELERDLGVPAPQKIPTIFQCEASTLRTERELSFVGNKTCGEVEYVIILKDGHTYIAVGSDHTDRDLESASVPKAKAVCAKPVSREIWDYEDIKGHWDQIELYSYQVVDGEEIPYQVGSLADILPVEDILKEMRERIGAIGNSVIFSGTVPVLNGFKYGSRFRGEMRDPVLGRKLTFLYDVNVIPEEER